AGAVPPPLGGLTQLASPNACVTESFGNGCNVGDGLAAAIGVAVSADGKSVYVASANGGSGGGVAAFARDPNTGALTTELGCVSEDAGGRCTAGDGLFN